MTHTTQFNCRENFQRMMSGQPYQRVPLQIEVTPPIADRIKQHTGTSNPAEAFHLDAETLRLPYPDLTAQWHEGYLQVLGVHLPDDAIITANGVATQIPPDGSTGEAYHFSQMLYPLATAQSVDQLEQLPFPDFSAWCQQTNDEVAARIDAIHQAGRVAMAPLECTVFERSWYSRGMDNLFMDMTDGNPIGDWLLDYHMNRSIAQGRQCVSLGCEVVRLGDDVGSQKGMLVSPEFWRQHLKPRLVKVIQAIRAAQRGSCYVFYHSDGDIREIIDELIEIGVDILNPLQPECMPVPQIIERYKDRLAFWGMIGTQTTMPFGSPEDVRTAVRQLVTMAHNGARIVLAPTHVLEPDVSWANIEALVGCDRAL